MDEKKQHWEKIYSTRSSEKLSWTQEHPSPSIEWILEAVPDHSDGIIDIGGGTSLLVNYLLEAGYKNPAVLDISGNALEQAKARLAEKQSEVEWIEADITSFRPNRKYSLWHDRAVFHFLTSRTDRINYLDSLKRCLVTNGKVIIATFSSEGPSQCSGLDIMRFNETQLSEEMGDAFKLIRSLRQTHVTPWGAKQEFLYCLFQT